MTSKSKALDGAKKEREHKHQFYLKSSGLHGKYWRECDTCKVKRPMTKYKMEV